MVPSIISKTELPEQLQIPFPRILATYKFPNIDEYRFTNLYSTVYKVHSYDHI